MESAGVLLPAFALVTATVWLIALASLRVVQRRRTFATLLWSLVLFYPGLFAVTAGRSIYYGETVTTEVSQGLSALTVLGAIGAMLLSIGIVASLSHRLPDRRLPLLVAALLSVGSLYLSDLAAGSIWPAGSILITAAVVIAIYTLHESADVLVPRLRILLRCYVLSSLLAVLVAPSWALVPPEFGGRDWLPSRLIGLTSSTNYMALIAALSLIMECVNLNRSPFWRFYAVVAAGACVWAQGRTGLAMAVLGLLALFMHSRSLHRGLIRLTYALVSVGLVLALAYLQLQNMIVEFFGRMNIQEFTTGRVGAWELAWTEVLAHPYFGGGSGFFSLEFWDTRNLPPYFANAHNQLLQSLAEGGVVGATAMVVFVSVLTAGCVRNVTETAGASLAVLMVVVAQLPFGAPLKVEGLTWNLIPLTCCLALAFAAPRGGVSAKNANTSALRASPTIPAEEDNHLARAR